MPSILIDEFCNLLRIVDLAYGGDGISAVMGADDQGLGFIIGDASNPQVPLHLPHIFVKLGAERRVFYIVDGTVEPFFAIYGHAATPCTKMRMIVRSEKQIKNAVVL